MNETTNYYGDDEPRAWTSLSDMWNRMEREVSNSPRERPVVPEGDPQYGPVSPVTVALVGGPKLHFELPLVYTIRDNALEVWESTGCSRFPLTSVLYWRSEFREREEIRARPLADRPQA